MGKKQPKKVEWSDLTTKQKVAEVVYFLIGFLVVLLLLTPFYWFPLAMPFVLLIGLPVMLYLQGKHFALVLGSSLLGAIFGFGWVLIVALIRGYSS